MSKYKSIVSVSHIVPGDIVQYPTQGPLVERQKQPFSYGYVHNVVYDGKDDVIGLDLLPVTSVAAARQAASRYHKIEADDVGSALGLAKDKDWAVHLSLTRLNADALGSNRTIQRVGKIGHTQQHIVIQRQIENFGEDKIYYPHRTGYAKPSENTWGLYVPVGIKKLQDDNEAQPAQETKPRAKKKNSLGGKVIDIDFKNAVQSFGLDKEIADAFAQPKNKVLRTLDSMRDLFELATSSPEKIGRYLTAEKKVLPQIPLASIPEKIPASLAEFLTMPLDDAPKRIKPITHLQEAMDLAQNRPEDLQHYYLFDSTPELRAFMEHVFPQIVNKSFPLENGTEIRDAAISHIKKVWSAVGEGYLHSIKTGEPKPEHRLENGNPVWTFVPKVQ